MTPNSREPDSPEHDRATIAQQVTRESERRARLGVPAAAGGVLFLLSGIILNASLKGLPTVGVLQGIAPALRGELSPPESPRANEVRFVSHHAFGLIAGSLLQSLALVILVLVLLFLLEAVRFRRPQTTPIARRAVLVGGLLMALIAFAHKLAQVIAAHGFATGHDFSGHAVEQALTRNTALLLTAYLGLLAGLGLIVGMVSVVLGAARSGLIPRWMMYLGMVAAVLVTPFGEVFGFVQGVLCAFWMVAIGFLLMKRLATDPPAWAAGEAIPWPSQAELRAERGGQGGAKQAGKGQPALSPAGADVAPDPAQPVSNSPPRKRRRKRGSRG